MPRKGPAPRRPLVADPVYNSPLVTQLVNKVLKGGKRSLAERIVYAALEGTPRQDRHRPRRHAQAGDGQREARRWRSRSRRVGGATYQVPVEVRAAAADHARPALAGQPTPASAARRPWSSGS